MNTSLKHVFLWCNFVFGPTKRGGGIWGLKWTKTKQFGAPYIYGSTPVIGGLEVAPLSFHFRFNHLGS